MLSFNFERNKEKNIQNYLNKYKLELKELSEENDQLEKKKDASQEINKAVITFSKRIFNSLLVIN